MSKKLTPAMADLLDAMRRGVRVHFINGLHSYYFRSDTRKPCTAQVMGLLDRGLLVPVGPHDMNVKLAPNAGGTHE